jgi:hypothetical protein
MVKMFRRMCEKIELSREIAFYDEKFIIHIRSKKLSEIYNLIFELMK